MCGQARATPAPENAADPLIGQRIADRYLLLARVGEGAAGVIYRGEHVTLRRPVAIKLLHHKLSGDDLAIERFRREATTVAEIDNDHVVKVFDFGKAPDGRLFFAMELLDGETLAHVIVREGRLAVPRVCDILVQLGEALMEAHAMGYVHRDLRPGNLFLITRKGRADFVKLLDFGLAKLLTPEGDAAQTSLGMTFGDPRYMSPEQARGHTLDRRSDIYALGIIGYEMLCGTPPFGGQKTLDVLQKQLDVIPTPPSAVRKDVPPWLEAIVLRALAKAPGERFLTVTRMIEAVRDEGRTAAPADGAKAASETPTAPAPAAASPGAPAPAAATAGAVRAGQTLMMASGAELDPGVKRTATGTRLASNADAFVTGPGVSGEPAVQASAAPPPAKAASVGASSRPSSMGGSSDRWFAAGEAANVAPEEDEARSDPATTEVCWDEDPEQLQRRRTGLLVGGVAFGLAAIGGIWFWASHRAPG
jgi:serine/threonine-protein kinase